LAVSVPSRRHWGLLATVVPGVTQLDLSHEVSAQHLDAARAAIAAWACDVDQLTAARALQSVGVAASPVNDVRDLLLEGPAARSPLFESVDFSDLGADPPHRPVIGRPFRWQGSSDVRIRGRGPKYGEHNAEAITCLAQLPQSTLRELYEAGVVVDVPRNLGPTPSSLADLVEGGVYREIDDAYRQRLERWSMSREERGAV
jgi:crotonobetainyl-CoA:carnitine CoA-transferase CaiB-like acyl-CoA transferase